jgi:hypothetical protein
MGNQTTKTIESTDKQTRSTSSSHGKVNNLPSGHITTVPRKSSHDENEDVSLF